MAGVTARPDSGYVGGALRKPHAMALSNQPDAPFRGRSLDAAGSEAPHPGGDPAASIADGRERRLDPRSVQAARLSASIAAAVLVAVLFGIVLALGAIVARRLADVLLLLGGWLAAGILLTVWLLAWPGVSYRHTAYRVSEQGMRIRRGVFWRTVSSVPRSRVQHTDVSQGPIERMFGLATLVVYTAGTHHASVSLNGLAHETALRIRDHLIPGGEDDAV